MPPPVYDPFAPGFTDDPYPQYAALRAGAPCPRPIPPRVSAPFAPGFPADPYPQSAVLRAGAPAGRHPLGFWLLTRYEDVSALLRANMSVEDSNVTDRE